ncbi:cofactor assembly of complex C subunit B [Oscillatoria sp. CS-180]|uniref:cofactor assembly of complex C subunit B n=1 Tax=Oscillatoria sp. CS-180 TaxID=3021720 RepID=UPI00232BDA37|nr:cofactor assembly of complex C subunit B [Oscillatoria sp. CS-180]MDB9528040.1 cofactor assembly of complex C subunit B [Oscillatoria sp. CS-180]
MPLIFDAALPSAFGLTFLLFIGLGFFIRASVKDRTETATYSAVLNDVMLMEDLQKYFSERAYRVTSIDAESGQISLAGKVGASIVLAIFLGSLAAIGLFCLGLVLAIAFPRLGYAPYGLLILSPIAVWFYWRGATRVEQVTFQILSPESSLSTQDKAIDSNITRLLVSAHRDELAVMESKLPLKRDEADSSIRLFHKLRP